VIEVIIFGLISVAKILIFIYQFGYKYLLNEDNFVINAKKESNQLTALFSFNVITKDI